MGKTIPFSAFSSSFVNRPALEQIGNISLCHHQLTPTAHQVYEVEEEALLSLRDKRNGFGNLIFKTRARQAQAAASPSLYTPFNTNITILFPSSFAFSRLHLHRASFTVYGPSIKTIAATARRKCHSTNSKQLNWSFYSFGKWRRNLFSFPPVLCGTMWTPICHRKKRKKKKSSIFFFPRIKNKIEMIKEINRRTRILGRLEFDAEWTMWWVTIENPSSPTAFQIFPLDEILNEMITSPSDIPVT